jgi:hypothetical protein
MQTPKSSKKATEENMITVLFARRDSVYKSLPDVDVWDADREAAYASVRGALAG